MTSHPPRVAIYPGSFDPLTNGHVDIIERGAKIFDAIIVAILANVEKTPLFTENERITIIRDVFKGHENVQVETFSGLLVDYAQLKNASVLVRGLRAVSDFEYEFQMALMNRHLAPGLETVFMMPDEKYTYISSRLIKEVFTLGGEITGLVPPVVEEKLRAKQKAEGKGQQMNFASRMSRVVASPTLRVAAEADRLRRQGVDVVDLGAGEPDFGTPEHVKDAAHAAIDANFTKYTPSAGVLELRDAVAQRYRLDYGVQFKPEEVIVTAGAKQALYNTAMVLFEPGR